MDLWGNKWVSKTYENRSSWVAAYFRDRFFARIRTISQCEAVNSTMKTYIDNKSSIFEFIHKFELALRGYRNNELKAHFNSLYSKPFLTTSLPDMDAGKIYTTKIFNEVKEQSAEACALFVTKQVVNGDRLIFKLTKHCDPSTEMKVGCDTSKSIFSCGCRRFELLDIPCSHILCVMKVEHVDHIPSSLILKRWTKETKSAFVLSVSSKGVDSDAMKLA